MAVSIEIEEAVDTLEDMIDMLEEIAKLIENGCTSGYNPDWSIIGYEEKSDI